MDRTRRPPPPGGVSDEAIALSATTMPALASVSAAVGVGADSTDVRRNRPMEWVERMARDLTALQWPDGSITAAAVRWPFNGAAHADAAAADDFHQSRWSVVAGGGGGYTTNRSIAFATDPSATADTAIGIIRTTAAACRALALVLPDAQDWSWRARAVAAAAASGWYLFKSVLRFHLLPLSRAADSAVVSVSPKVRAAALSAAHALYELSASVSDEPVPAIHDGDEPVPPFGGGLYGQVFSSAITV